MKIALLSFYNGLVNRGAETYVYELASRLSKQTEVIVYQNGKSGSSDPYSTNYLPSKYFLPNFSVKPDIIIPVNGRLQTVQSKLWAINNKAKVIVSGQSGIGFDDRLNLYSFPDVFVSLTGFQLAWAKKNNPFIKHTLIPNGVDISKYSLQHVSRNINRTKPVVLYVAAFEPIKRHKLLIDAISKTQATLILVGQGSLESEIRNYCEQKITSNRFKILSLPYTQMPDIYKQADLFVYPTSPWESFGISILEALASGLPVVATNDPIRKEIIGPAGILVDPTNTTEFASAIEKALSLKWNDLPIKQANKYSWDNVANEYLKICNSL